MKMTDYLHLVFGINVVFCILSYQKLSSFPYVTYCPIITEFIGMVLLRHVGYSLYKVIICIFWCDNISFFNILCVSNLEERMLTACAKLLQ
jgi:hypothetical protein